MTSIIEKGTQQLMPLNKLKRNPLNTYEMNEMDDLKNSIVTYGLITPISVIGPDADGCYVLIAGERRLNIFTELYNAGDEKYKELPAYIIGTIGMSETEQKLLIEASNLDTRNGFDKNVHYLNVIKLLKEYQEENGLSDPEYIKLRKEYLKCSPRYARLYEAIFEKGSDELISMVENGEVSVSRAGRIATMPEDIQDSAIHDLKSGINQDEVVKKHSQMQKEDRKKKNSDVFDFADDLNDDFEDFDDLADDFPTDNFDFDEDEDFDDIDFDQMSTDFLNTDTTQSFSSMRSKHENELKTVIQWCKRIVNVTNPTEEEWEAINACKKIAETF